VETLLKVLSGPLLWHLASESWSLIIQEGKDVNTNCDFSKSFYSLSWYWQKHGEVPVFLMMLVKDGEEKSYDKIPATFNEKKQQSSLFITASQNSHAGTYFCGVEAQRHPGPQSLYSNLKPGHRCSPNTRLLWGTYQKAHPLKRET
uniref:Ig-like domain-containing protein n=1 Tax=Equus asinus TaxID=9793 RepID=A0A9L0KBI7_EQUAS